MDSAGGGLKRVLVVEDQYELMRELVSHLTVQGFEVESVPTVERAFDYIRQASRLDAAILDINLDGGMVFPVADALAEREIPFFFASGYTRDIVPPRFADRIFVEKPLDMQRISSALRECSRPRDKQGGHRNLIFSALKASEMALLRPHLTSVPLVQGAVLEEQFDEICSVYFVERGVLSLIAVSLGGVQVEAGVIGREGLTGFGLLDSDLHTPFRLVVQVEGSAQRISVDHFLRLLWRTPQLRSLAAAFSRSLAIQISYTALANGRYTTDQRLARWLVMMGDRSETQLVELTHDYLAVMLGVRRPSVTDALHVLEGERLIRSVRGKVILVDREGLIAKAGGSYGIPESEYARLMGFAIR